MLEVRLMPLVVLVLRYSTAPLFFAMRVEKEISYIKFHTVSCVAQLIHFYRYEYHLRPWFLIFGEEDEII